MLLCSEVFGYGSHAYYNRLDSLCRLELCTSIDTRVVSVSNPRGFMYTCICSLVRHIKKDERKYYESLLQYSREHLMVSF